MEKGQAVDLGVWMSSDVWQHKSQTDVRRQAWNLRQLPEDFLRRSCRCRLHVAIRGQWRGYFVLAGFCWNPVDRRCPFTLTFDPRSWTPMAAGRAPAQNRHRGYTLDVPKVRAPSGQRKNEIEPGYLRLQGTRRSNESKTKSRNEIEASPRTLASK